MLVLMLVAEVLWWLSPGKGGEAALALPSLIQISL